MKYPEYVLNVVESDPAGVRFSTTGHRPQWVDESELDAARFRVRGATGRTWLAGHSVCEQDVTDLHNAIRSARDRYDLANDCRGCHNEPADDGDEYGEACLRSRDRRDEEQQDWDLGGAS